ncbi:hypothetical protein AB837_00139 [bacterium AB1]|nr:hypothetical protein AB837_00139 [bacterium AB1]
MKKHIVKEHFSCSFNDEILTKHLQSCDIEKITTINTIKDWLNLISKVSQTYRRGFNGQKYLESNAAHKYKISMMVIYLNKVYDLNLNVEKCIYLAFIHDVAESYIKDVTPADTDVDPDIRHQLELKVMQKIFSTNNPELKKLCNDMLAYYNEYSNKQTKEAKIVSILDKIDFCQEYIRNGDSDTLKMYLLDQMHMNIRKLKKILKIDLEINYHDLTNIEFLY